MSQTCPDRQLLSVYVDGELPSPWKEKMEDHLAKCSACNKKVESYQYLSLELAPKEEASLKAAQERIRQKLYPRLPGRKAIPGSLWHRRLSIPIPAAAAAVVLIIASAFFWVTMRQEAAEMPDATLIAEDTVEMLDINPVMDLGDVLQYLSSYDSNDLLVIRLPESRSFVSHGNPAIIRAADYSRLVSDRQMPGDRP